MKPNHIALLCLLGTSSVLAGCAGPGGLSEQQGTLAGAAGGALVGAALSGGLIVPALAAAGGAVVGEEVAENDPIFD